MPWMYRLVAAPFLQHNLTVAIVGYRTYPDAVSDEMVDDLNSAMQKIQQTYPRLFEQRDDKNSLGICVMGHSSGAHISFLMVIENTRRRMMMQQQQQKKSFAVPVFPIDCFVGLSGVYDIGHHFDYEAARGVEELSPMKAANGMTPEQFRRYAPAHRLQQMLLRNNNNNNNQRFQEYLPTILLLHGMEDATVPFTSTSEAARRIRSCGITRLDEIYVAKLGHEEAILQMMMGGPTRDNVLEWLLHKKPSTTDCGSNLKIASKL